MMRNKILVLAAACSVLSLGSAAGAQVVSPSQAFEGTRLDIVAMGESRQVPDIAVITAGVVTQAPTASAALTDNNRRMQAVFRALDAAGIEERDIQTSSINLSARYDRSNRSEQRLLGHTASNQLTVRFRDIQNAGAIIDALVAQGVNQISGPNLQIDAPEAAMDEARRDAIAKARQRAELYATAAGMRVVRIVAISEAGAARPSVMMDRRGMMSGVVESAPMQIAAGEQRLTASVSVTFELQ